MLHAVAMPVETFYQKHSDGLTQFNASHSCDEPLPADKQCKLSDHICCLGITATTSNKATTDESLTKLFNPMFETLAVQIYPDKRFKPPKKSLQN
jgi:hypothetical protein